MDAHDKKARAEARMREAEVRMRNTEARMCDAEARIRDVEVRMRDGFVGQRMWVVPKPWLQSLPAQPILHSLQVTDIGWFPNARYHYR